MRLSELVDQSFQTYPSCYAMCELKTAIAWAGNTAKLSNERSHKPKQQWASKDELVRASGTEPVIRVMVEAVSADLTHYWAQQLVLAVQQHLQS